MDAPVGEARLRRALSVVARREATVRAWAHLDPHGAERALLDGHDGPLAGLVLGVKDVFDTVDMPTAYGTGLYARHRPAWDASAVALLRAAGAVCLGKTVTAELAMYTPGPTTNPWSSTRTPGGSSSGSAAAVACGMADVALGTQTAGSVIRPAAFCGVWGFKPTFAAVSVAGVKLVAPSLDTVGWFARDVAGLDAVRCVLTGAPPARPLDRAPVVAVVRTEQWGRAEPDCRRAVVAVARAAQEAGATVVDAELPGSCSGLADAAVDVMAREAWSSLAWERSRPEALSEGLRRILSRGGAVPVSRRDEVLAARLVAAEDFASSLSGVDVALTPAVVGEAPPWRAGTGDPRFCRLWTLLGVPAVAVPGATGRTGLPLGVQLVAPKGADDRLISASAWLSAVLRRRS